MIDLLINTGSILNEGFALDKFFICLFSALLAGAILATFSYFRSRSSKGFFITTCLIPAAVAMVIALVNGNIGVGVAVAGAFALVRFRSSPGTAREICIIFIAMASGLAFGTGYIVYGLIFSSICGLILLILNLIPVWDHRYSQKEKYLDIVIPEDINYNQVFEDLLKKYTKHYELIKVKSTNLGTMFKLKYYVVLKNPKEEKEFLDQIRMRNGNLEVALLQYDVNDVL